MKYKFKEIAPSLFLTILFLVILEVLVTAIFPPLGFEQFRLSFNVLIILYFGFKVESPFLPLFILVLQFFHSAFSIEGWAIGTFAGVMVCVLAGYLKDFLNFSTNLSTMVVTQIFQFFWFFITSGIIYLKTGNGLYLIERFWLFLPESLLLSLLSPFFFVLLDRIWKTNEEMTLRNNL